ncbi:neuropeptide receptor 22-like [Oculina patagonica]
MTNSTHISFDDQASCRLGVSIFFTSAMAIISSAAVIGNILVIVTVYKTPSLRTSTNYFFVNMAVSDLLACITTWPMYLTDETSGSLLQGSSVECKMAIFSRMVSIIVSVISLVLIAFDRFIVTVLPLKATLITRNVRVILLFATWFISAMYCIPLLYYFRTEEIGQETLCKPTWNDFGVMIYNITGFALFIVTPFITIIILYSHIMPVWRERLNSMCNARSTNTQQKRIRQNQNIVKIFKSIVVLLFTWFSLFCLYLFLKMLTPEIFIKDRCKLIEGFGFYLSPLLSTATNPVNLFAFSSNFRKTLPDGCPFAFGKLPACCKAGTISSQQENELLELVSYKKTLHSSVCPSILKSMKTGLLQK